MYFNIEIIWNDQSVFNLFVKIAIEFYFLEWKIFKSFDYSISGILFWVFDRGEKVWKLLVKFYVLKDG